MTENVRGRSLSRDEDVSATSAFLFDLDGTIADTSLAHGHAYRLAFAEIGRSISEYDFEPLSGHHFSEVIQRLSGGLPHDEARALHRRKTQLFVKIAKHYIQPLPLLGVAQSIRRHLPIALVTSATNETARCVLKVISAEDLFHVMVVSEDVQRAKPAPEPYLVACNRLGMRASDCIAFEDSSSGYLSASRAGMKVVQVSKFFGKV